MNPARDLSDEEGDGSGYSALPPALRAALDRFRFGPIVGMQNGQPIRGPRDHYAALLASAETLL